jgi:hypothetical protein
VAPEETGNDGGLAVGADREELTGGLGALPGVEGDDEREGGPGLLGAGVDLLLRLGVQQEPQALVVGEPTRPYMPGDGLLLLGGRFGSEAECGEASHGARIAVGCDNAE